MEAADTAPKAGLEGVSVADSAICKIDGATGELRYCGYLIRELANQSDFAETAYLLWHGELPTAAELDALRTDLRAQREVRPETLELIRVLAENSSPMDCLRTVVSSLASDVPQDQVLTTERKANLARSVSLTAKLPTVVAAYDRLRKGLDIVAPRADLDHGANFLWMLNGEEATEEAASIFDTCLVLHAEHGFNASTFSARVTAATMSDMWSAITSAIGTLRGPLHGGANTAVMNMLIETGSVDGVEAHLDGMLDRREKIMGFGHRVYRVVDPRALILEDFAKRLAAASDEPKWYEMSKRLEVLMKERKGIDMNVDFYSASTYHYLGIDGDLFTCVFALSRIAGWTAHVLEQYSNNRLIRPRSNWIGPDARAFVPLADRG